MIRNLYIDEYSEILKKIKQDIFQNVYLYIDTKEYGFFYDDKIETLVIEEDNQICIIVYRYYNSIQLFKIKDVCENSYVQIAEYILKNSISMISGETEIVDKIIKNLPDSFKMFEGSILTYEKSIMSKPEILSLAENKDVYEIAELICSDYNIGGHYSVEMLCDQLIDRMDNHNCRNLIVKKDSVIISHMGTYAEYDDIAVMGGLITLPKFRGQGYGSKVLFGLAKMVMDEGKIPIIYCYRDSLKEWYIKQGWIVKAQCAKIENISS